MKSYTNTQRKKIQGQVQGIIAMATPACDCQLHLIGSLSTYQVQYHCLSPCKLKDDWLQLDFQGQE